MSILSVFKKKETKADIVAAEALDKKENGVEKPAKKVKEVKEEKTSVDLSSFKGIKANVLIRPIVTEKSAILSADGRYTFQIADYATKQEIHQIVEKRFKVHVTRVNVVTVHPKKRMRGAIEGRISGYRKAVVFVRKGEVIDFTK
ncbi:MAG: 50S ribosomal protein L23 [bacterium]|nr:50S ribosomal protein L23 [bacterium]